MPNRNTVWARTFVDELARQGLRYACVAPGSRSTALTLAFAQHEAITVYKHLDERSAAFFALGLALSTHEPVALVCTSGTAVANFFPAVIESFMAQVPLLVLTTDRPHELRMSGANQTIDQIKIYGDHVLWSVDVTLPENQPTAIAYRNLRTLAARAYAMANGLRKGPVHLNFPFRKPLEPTPVNTDKIDIPAQALPRPDFQPYTTFSHGDLQPGAAIIENLYGYIKHAKRGVIVCGARCPQGEFPNLVRQLSQRFSLPILADVLSGVRWVGEDSEGNVLSAYNMWLPSIPSKPDLIIQFGAMPVATPLLQFLNITDAIRIQISSDGTWADADHVTHDFIQVNPLALCQKLLEKPPIEHRSYTSLLSQIDAAARTAIEAFFEDDTLSDMAVVFDIARLLPNNTNLFIGNSLPIRHFDELGFPNDKAINTYANRGASGIDGNVSTAFGVKAANTEKRLVAVFGDVTFFHDMNGLLAAKAYNLPAIIIIINNDGGGIFKRLPVRNFEPEFTDYFVMPHGLAFSHIAEMFGFSYYCPATRTEFQSIFQEALASDDTRQVIIEVRTEIAQDFEQHQRLLSYVQQALKGFIQKFVQDKEENLHDI